MAMRLGHGRRVRRVFRLLRVFGSERHFVISRYRNRDRVLIVITTGRLQWKYYLNGRGRETEWKCQPSRYLPGHLVRDQIKWGCVGLMVTNVVSAAVAAHVVCGGYSRVYMSVGQYPYWWWILQWPVIFVQQVNQRRFQSVYQGVSSGIPSLCPPVGERQDAPAIHKNPCSKYNCNLFFYTYYRITRRIGSIGRFTPSFCSNISTAYTTGTFNLPRGP